jgi:membrane-associated phospholipid phosphatase
MMHHEHFLNWIKERCIPINSTDRIKIMWNNVITLLEKFTPGSLLALSALFISTYVFFDLAGDVWFKEGFAWDKPIMLAIHDRSTPWLDSLFKMISYTASKWVLIPIVIIAGWFWYIGQPIRITLIIISYVGATLLNFGLKSIFERSRPDFFIPLVVETSHSFPSGHTATAMGFYGLLALLFWKDRRYLIAALCAIWVGLIGFSRIYLGVHYPSDVVASLAVGIIWIILLLTVSGRLGYPLTRQDTPMT